MPRAKLTAGRILAFKCPSDKVQAFLWDSEVPGLGVRATQSGSKAFVFQGRIGGSEPRITIGDTRSRDIESGDPKQPGAREEARRLQRLIDQGIDPRQEKAERIAASVGKRKAATLHETATAEAWQRYIAERTTKWSARHLADHLNFAAAGGTPWKRGKRKTVAGALAPLLALKLREVDDDRVKDWLRAESKRRPTQARIAFGALRAFLNWCGDQPDYRGVVHLGACSPRIAKQALPRKCAGCQILYWRHTCNACSSLARGARKWRRCYGRTSISAGDASPSATRSTGRAPFRLRPTCRI